MYNILFYRYNQMIQEDARTNKENETVILTVWLVFIKLYC